MCSIVGESLLADAFSAHEDFVGSTIGAAGSIDCGLGSSGADSASSLDSAKTLQALALMGVRIVLFVGSALLGADAELVGEVSADAVAVAGVGVVLGVDGAGDAVAVADEIVGRAFLAGSSQ